MPSVAQGRQSFSYSIDERRFFSLHEEGAHRYRPGGLHPVSIGEVYESLIARYKIIHKLGWGSFSTVWLASTLDLQGTPLRQYRALKFRQSNISGLGMERIMLRRIAARPSVHLGRDYMIRLYDDFEVCGPNGKHEVFVIEVTGPTLDEMISSASDPETDHLPDTLVRRWARQLLLSLGYLATEGIVHGDLHPNNVAMAVTFLDGRSEDEVVNMFGDGSVSDTRCRNSVMARFLGLSVPRQTITRGSLLPEFVQSMRVVKENLDLRLIDFSQAVPSHRLASYSLHTPDIFRAPELQVFQKPSATNPFAVDVWAAGCIIFTLATGRQLFLRTASVYLKDISRTIGGLRPEFWPESHWINDESDREDSRLPYDGSLFTAFVRALLAPDPDCRPALPLDDLPNHSWLSSPLPPDENRKTDRRKSLARCRQCFCIIL